MDLLSSEGLCEEAVHACLEGLFLETRLLVGCDTRYEGLRTVGTLV